MIRLNPNWHATASNYKFFTVATWHQCVRPYNKTVESTVYPDDSSSLKLDHFTYLPATWYSASLSQKKAEDGMPLLDPNKQPIVQTSLSLYWTEPTTTIRLTTGEVVSELHFAGIIRQSNHWGRVGTSFWPVGKEGPERGVLILPKLICAKCAYDEFRIAPVYSGDDGWIRIQRKIDLKKEAIRQAYNSPDRNLQKLEAAVSNLNAMVAAANQIWLLDTGRAVFNNRL